MNPGKAAGAAVMHIGILSVELTVACRSRRVLGTLRDLFRFFPVELTRLGGNADFEVRERSGSYTLFEEGQVLIDTDCRAYFTAWLEYRIFEELIHRESRHLLLHAGAVAGRNSGVVLSGEKGCGKTTLTARLVQDGFSYLSDDTTALSFENGKLVPLPRALHIKDASALPARGEFRLASYDGASSEYPARYALPPASQVARVPVEPSCVVFPSYKPGKRTRLRPLPGSLAAVLLARQAQNLPDHMPRGFELIAKLVEKVPAYSLDYGHADDALKRVRDLLGC
ncbi:MAG TPA: hypothetical protein VM425_20650 [Myxococcota bacterium]|nr:hypothetical protein [Myxococcota bacterium]